MSSRVTRRSLSPFRRWSTNNGDDSNENNNSNNTIDKTPSRSLFPRAPTITSESADQTQSTPSTFLYPLSPSNSATSSNVFPSTSIARSNIQMNQRDSSTKRQRQRLIPSASDTIMEAASSSSVPMARPTGIYSHSSSSSISSTSARRPTSITKLPSSSRDTIRSSSSRTHPRKDATSSSVVEARKTWNARGEHATQAFENRRSELLHTTFQSEDNSIGINSYSDQNQDYNNNHHNNNNLLQQQQHNSGHNSQNAVQNSITNKAFTSSSPNNQITLSVRITTSETRQDASGANYTVYLICVERSNGDRYNLEHRYSEFLKLYKELFINHIHLQAKFPTRHWAGRIGDWTPSLSWAPESHRELIRQRESLLDCWIVELAEMLQNPREQLLRKELQDLVREFFSVSSADLAPCDRSNQLSWNGFHDDDEESVGSQLRGWVRTAFSKGNDAIRRSGSCASMESSVHEDAVSSVKYANGKLQQYVSNPITFTLGSMIRQAAYTVMHMCGTKSTLTIKGDQSDQVIPLDLLHQAKGLCFLTVVKCGFMVSMRTGTGLIIAKRKNGWTPPSAIGTFGMGWGALIGGDITDYLIVLNTEKAVKAFCAGTVNLGAELGVSMGPIGRSASSHLNADKSSRSVVPAYAYAHSKGLFAGISLESGIITTRPDVNTKFYGRPIDAEDLLFEHVQPRPLACQPLYDALDEAMKLDVPERGFRPSRILRN